MRKIVNIFFSLILLGTYFFAPLNAQAYDDPLRLRFAMEAIQHGYTAEYRNADFRLAVMPNLVNEAITLEMKQFDGAAELPLLDGKKLVSDYFIYDILSQAGNNPIALNRPLILAVRFQSDTLYRKVIHYWASNKQQWIPLPSTTDYTGRYVRAYSHLPFSRIAVFEDPNSFEGVASWYRDSRYPYGAAIDAYPIGTKLRVTSIENNISIIVQVTSHGLNAPGRVIDLTSNGFSKLAPLSQGLTRVKVEPVDGLVLGLQAPGPAAPAIVSKAAIAINEKTGAILYVKNKDMRLPMASLTKIMTATVFLEMNIPWDKVVTYQAQDNAIGSKLYVNVGDTMTVKDLYYTSLVGSANNATNALVRSTGLSRADFVNRMNAKASAWGLTNTHFADVTGLDPANVTTVGDYAVLATRALKDFRLLQGTTTHSYSFTTINTGVAHTIVNKDKMVDSSWYISGTKTGYLDEALYCLMTKARKDKLSSPDVITVVLGSGSDAQRYAETNALIQYALSK